MIAFSKRMFHNFQNLLWIIELQTQGYKDPLFVPSSFSQAILASIHSPTFHSIIIDFDILALSKDTPSILLTASYNDWLWLLHTSLKVVPRRQLINLMLS